MTKQGLSNGAAQTLVGADRVLAVLVEVAASPQGTTLEELADRLSSPKPTVHRALASLRRAKLVDQIGRGQYVLGDEFIHLAFANANERPDNVQLQPILNALVEQFGEAAHYAVLAGREVIYRAKADPVGRAVRLTSIVGGRNPAHCTAVGKLLLAQKLFSVDQVVEWAGDEPLEARTGATITDPVALHRELSTIRERGYSLEEEENEPGIGCLAVPFCPPHSSSITGAVSLSALLYRTPMKTLVDGVPLIRRTIEAAGAAAPLSIT